MKPVLALAALLLLLAGCGSDSPTLPSAPPPPPYPAVSGTYRISATFDGVAESGAFASGTITFTQASQQSGTLSATCNVTATVSGQRFAFVQVWNPILTPSGGISFSIGTSPGGWNFEGTATGGGVSIASFGGRHILGAQFPGSWTATR